MANIYNFFKFLEEKKGKKITLRKKFELAPPEDFTPEELNIEGNLYLNKSKHIKSLPPGLKVGGRLDLTDSLSFEYLPDNLEVGSLDASNTSIRELPDNLKVHGTLKMDKTRLSTIPDNLQVDGYMTLRDTPLAANHPKELILKMIEDKGGYVKGNEVDKIHV